MNLIIFIQTIIDYILNPDELMAILWIPTIISSIILFLYVLLKVSSYLEYQKNNFLLTCVVLALGLGAFMHSVLTFTPFIQNFTDPAPLNVRITQVGASEVIIQWETKIADLQYVIYSPDPDSQFIANTYETTPEKIHTVLLSDLTPGKNYKLKIIYSAKELTTFNGKPLEFSLR